MLPTPVNRSLAYLSMGALAGLFMLPSKAHACQPPRCGPGRVLPYRGTVPANMSGFLWSVGGEWEARVPTLDDVSLVERETQRRVDVTLSHPRPDPNEPEWSWMWLVAPTTSLTPHMTYDLTLKNMCKDVSHDDARVSVQTGAISPWPTRFGHLVVTRTETGPLRVATHSGSCFVDVSAAQVYVRLVFDPSAEPWRHAVTFETLVDGRPWTPSASVGAPLHFGASWQGPGDDLLFTICDGRAASYNLRAGTHSVAMVVRAPGFGPSFVDPIDITLSCDPPSTDAGVLDGDAPPSADASSNDNGGLRDDGRPQNLRLADPAGCGCRAGLREHSGLGWGCKLTCIVGLVLALGRAGLRRRAEDVKSRRRHPQSCLNPRA